MNKMELGKILHDMYNGAADGDSVAMIHLFGIKYADEIKAFGFTARELAEAAEIPVSYGTEISKGVKLSKFVRPV